MIVFVVEVISMPDASVVFDALDYNAHDRELLLIRMELPFIK